MGTSIVFINEKGGVGKTSLCFNVGWALAEQGKKVCMIDLDGQIANLSFFCGVNKKNCKTMYDVLVKNCPVTEAIKEVREGLHIIPATDDVIALTSQNSKITAMQRAVRTLEPIYDFVFLDLNPTPGRSHALALASAKFAIIPMLPDVTSLAANMGIVESVRIAQKSANPDLKVLGLVFNRYSWRSLLSRQVTETAEKMAASLGSKVFNARIRSNTALSETVGQHVGVTSYSPKSNGSLDVQRLCQEIIQEVKNHE